jgi:hypothetical protein
MGEWNDKVGVLYPDFSKRICALRELYEETNLLYARKYGDAAIEKPNLQIYNEKYNQNFAKFCMSYGIVPDISKMYGFTRVGTPIGMYPVNDT